MSEPKLLMFDNQNNGADHNGGHCQRPTTLPVPLTDPRCLNPNSPLSKFVDKCQAVLKIKAQLDQQKAKKNPVEESWSLQLLPDYHSPEFAPPPEQAPCEDKKEKTESKRIRRDCNATKSDKHFSPELRELIEPSNVPTGEPCPQPMPVTYRLLDVPRENQNGPILVNETYPELAKYIRQLMDANTATNAMYGISFEAPAFRDVPLEARPNPYDILIPTVIEGLLNKLISSSSLSQEETEMFANFVNVAKSLEPQDLKTYFHLLNMRGVTLWDALDRLHTRIMELKSHELSSAKIKNFLRNLKNAVLFGDPREKKREKERLKMELASRLAEALRETKEWILNPLGYAKQEKATEATPSTRLSKTLSKGEKEEKVEKGEKGTKWSKGVKESKGEREKMGEKVEKVEKREDGAPSSREPLSKKEAPQVSEKGKRPAEGTIEGPEIKEEASKFLKMKGKTQLQLGGAKKKEKEPARPSKEATPQQAAKTKKKEPRESTHLTDFDLITQPTSTITKDDEVLSDKTEDKSSKKKKPKDTGTPGSEEAQEGVQIMQPKINVESYEAPPGGRRNSRDFKDENPLFPPDPDTISVKSQKTGVDRDFRTKLASAISAAQKYADKTLFVQDSYAPEELVKTQKPSITEPSVEVLRPLLNKVPSKIFDDKLQLLERYSFMSSGAHKPGYYEPWDVEWPWPDLQEYIKSIKDRYVRILPDPKFVFRRGMEFYQSEFERLSPVK